MNVRVVDKLKSLDILIFKRIIAISKINNIKKLPSPLQMKILKYLICHKDQKICQKDLEVALNVSKATISEVLNKMEKEGIMKRVVDESDHRLKTLMITCQSLEEFSLMEKSFDKLNTDLIKDISEKDLEVFLRVIDRMQENLKKERN